MRLNEIVPWGRTLEEYKLMFNLTDTDLRKKIIGCGDGPASFNCEMTELGFSVVSIDPIYQFSREQIKQRVYEVYEPVVSQVKQNAHRFVWKNFSDAVELGRVRLKTMEKFLSDYENGKQAERYLPLSLPSLDLLDNQFDLCLCSHLLFLYSEQLSLDFHLASIRELLRICDEVRIFPLLTLDCEPSPYVEIVMQELDSKGFKVDIQQVSYEFQKGGNQMLNICKR